MIVNRLIKNIRRKSAAGFLPMLLAFILIVCPSAYAQDENTDEPNEEDVLDLGTLYVEDTLPDAGEILDRPTAFATVLDPQELSRRSLTLSEALDSVPGVSIRSFGGLGSLSTISIRGMGSENVLILLDGIPLNPTGGSVDLSDIPLGSLERIEVLRGGEGAFTGGGAVGGVIRLTSLSADDDSGTTRSGRLSLGSFNTATGAFTWRAPGDLFHFEMAGSRGEFPFLNDNGTSFDTSDDFIDTRVNNEFSSVEARYGHSWKFDESRTFGISMEYFRAEKGIPGITTFPSPNASQTDNRVFLHALYSDPAYQDGKLNMSIAWLRQGRHFADEFGESTGVPLFTSWIHNRIEPKIEWTGIGFGDDDVLTVGTSFALETLDAGEYDNPSRDTLSAWVRDEWYYQSGAVLAGGFRNDLVDGDNTISPRAGLKYPFDDNLTARTNFGLDFRPPSFEELYRNEGMVIGNPDLVPERTLNFDIGLTHTSEKFRIEAVYFNIQTKDLIDYLLISGFRWKPYNIGRARSSGFEMSIDWILDEDWELRGNYTRTRAIDTSGDPTRQGMPLVGQPSSDLFAELRWNPDPWEIFINWERRGSSPITPSGTRFLQSNNSAGLGLGYNFSEGESLLFEVKNLFDYDLTDVRGFPLPGRSYFLTLKGEW